MLTLHLTSDKHSSVCQSPCPFQHHAIDNAKLNALKITLAQLDAFYFDP
jgi:hypothetical protein